MRHNFHARMEWLQTDCLLVCSSFLLFGLWFIFSDAQESLGNKIFGGLLLLFAHILASETWRAFSFYFRDWIWKLGKSRVKAHSKLNHLLNPGSWSGASETWTLLFSVVIIIEGGLLFVSNYMLLFVNFTRVYQINLIFLTLMQCYVIQHSIT